MSWIQTRSGKKFDPLNPDPATIDIEDIAHALSQVCRFTGHCSRFYSVAEHSVRVSRRVFQLTGDWEQAMWGLLHDASEAYLADIARPVKRTPELLLYCRIEGRLQRRIAHRFNLGSEEPAAVKRADVELLGVEATELMQPLHPEWLACAPPGTFPAIEYPGRESLGWAPDVARDRFLIRFDMLRKILSNTLTIEWSAP